MAVQRSTVKAKALKQKETKKQAAELATAPRYIAPRAHSRSRPCLGEANVPLRAKHETKGAAKGGILSEDETEID